MTYQQLHLNLPHQPSRPIFIGSTCILDALKTLQLSSKRIFIITQEHLQKTLVTPIYNVLSQNSFETHVICVPNGETAKSITNFSNCLDQLFAIGVERSDTIISVGGGVITDLAGFLASSCLRGLNLIHIPTTLLAQVDASIGGKTGINHKSGKNLIGAFYQPHAVICDSSVLSTLPKEECLSGFAEIIKISLIKDPSLYDTLKTHAKTLMKFDFTNNATLWNEIISKSCQHKIDIVSQDEKEAGIRALLNFGHTIGHAIEAFFNYKTYKHGECVIFGICAATFIAEKRNLISAAAATHIYTLIKDYNYHHTTLKSFSLADVLPILKQDKKVKKDTLHFVLLTAIGKAKVVSDITQDDIEKSIDFIHDFFKGDIK